MFLYIILAILIFGFLILIHEFGHYLTARIFKVEISEFAIGMGPKLLSIVSKKTGIRYSIRALPFGGFVSMRGELDDEEDQTPENPFAHEAVPHGDVNQIEPKSAGENSKKPGEEGYVINQGNALVSRPGWQRLIVHSAGALMNIILAVILTLILVLVINIGGTTVGEFNPPVDDGNGNLISSSDTLALGDTILSVNGKRVYISDQLYYQIMREGYRGDALDLFVRHEDGTKEHLQVVFPTETASGQSFGSADFKVYAEEKTFGTVIKNAFWKSCYVVEMIWESLFDLVTGRYSIEAVSGPVGTAGAITQAAQSGGPPLLYLTLVISMNLGIFNLLPIPPLDGGHVLYTLVEMITKRRVSGKITSVLDTMGTVLFFGFLIFITIKDIIALF